MFFIPSIAVVTLFLELRAVDGLRVRSTKPTVEAFRFMYSQAASDGGSGDVGLQQLLNHAPRRSGRAGGGAGILARHATSENLNRIAQVISPQQSRVRDSALRDVQLGPLRKFATSQNMARVQRIGGGGSPSASDTIELAKFLKYAMPSGAQNLAPEDVQLAQLRKFATPENMARVQRMVAGGETSTSDKLEMVKVLKLARQSYIQNVAPLRAQLAQLGKFATSENMARVQRIVAGGTPSASDKLELAKFLKMARPSDGRNIAPEGVQLAQLRKFATPENIARVQRVAGRGEASTSDKFEMAKAVELARPSDIQNVAPLSAHLAQLRKFATNENMARLQRIGGGGMPSASDKLELAKFLKTAKPSGIQNIAPDGVQLARLRLATFGDMARAQGMAAGGEASASDKFDMAKVFNLLGSSDRQNVAPRGAQLEQLRKLATPENMARVQRIAGGGTATIGDKLELARLLSSASVSDIRNIGDMVTAAGKVKDAVDSSGFSGLGRSGFAALTPASQ